MVICSGAFAGTIVTSGSTKMLSEIFGNSYQMESSSFNDQERIFASAYVPACALASSALPETKSVCSALSKVRERISVVFFVPS